MLSDINWILEEIKNHHLSQKNINIILKNTHFTDKELDELIDAIIISKNAQSIFVLANNHPNKRITDLTNAIIKTHSNRFIYYFAMYVENAPIEILGDAIIKNKNLDYITDFSAHVKNCNQNKYTDAIFKIGTMSDLESYFLEIETSEVNALNLDYIENKIMKDNKYPDLLVFIAKYFPQSNKTSILDYLFMFGSDTTLINYAETVSEAPLYTIAEELIKRGSYTSILDYAKRVKDAPKDILDEFMSSCENLDILHQYVVNVPNINAPLIYDRIIELQNKEYIETQLAKTEEENKFKNYKIDNDLYVEILNIMMKTLDNFSLLKNLRDAKNNYKKDDIEYVLRKTQAPELIQLYDIYLPYFIKELTLEEENDLDNLYAAYCTNGAIYSYPKGLKRSR